MADPFVCRGEDDYTANLQRVMRSHFGPYAQTFPVFNGTGANVVGLQSMLPRWGAVICAQTAHINTDENAAPENFLHALFSMKAGDEAFEKMFERDKDELRSLGIPIEVGYLDRAFEDEPGYRIERSAFELPQIDLEPDEAAVVGLAARVWQHAGLAATTTQALVKLKAAGVGVHDRLGLEQQRRRRQPADRIERLEEKVRLGPRISLAFRVRRRGG